MIKATIRKSTFCNQILKTKQHVHCFWPVTKCFYRGRGGLSSFKYLNSREYHASDFNSSGSNNLSVAIVGSGPSGFYSAKYLQMAIQKAKENENSDDVNDHSTIHLMNQIDIDLIDRLPTPFGLVRSGVAPDHPEVKNVENDFIKVIQKANENDDDDNMKSSMEFRGNVRIGKDVSLQELRDLYDVVILAYGCESDKKLGVEIERKNQQNYDSEKSLQGVYSAREFVAWYNGHPDYAHLGETFRRMLGDGHPETAEVVVIGQGMRKENKKMIEL
jgi:adrenodoxin-NADP+ reductase